MRACAGGHAVRVRLGAVDGFDFVREADILKGRWRQPAGGQLLRSLITLITLRADGKELVMLLMLDIVGLGIWASASA